MTAFADIFESAPTAIYAAAYGILLVVFLIGTHRGAVTETIG